MILEGLLGDGTNLDSADTVTLTDTDEQGRIRLQQALQRRLERMREPQVFHSIEPEPRVKTGYPEIEPEDELEVPDVAQRRRRRTDFHRKLRKKLAKGEPDERLDPHAPRTRAPEGMPRHAKPPTWFRGRPDKQHEEADEVHARPEPKADPEPIRGGDSLASRARRLKKQRKRDGD